MTNLTARKYSVKSGRKLLTHVLTADISLVRGNKSCLALITH